MTVETDACRRTYLADGSTSVFPYGGEGGFRIFRDEDLVVTTLAPSGARATLALGTDYTVTGAGTYAGGNVVTASNPASGLKVSVARVLAATQDTDLRNQSAFYAELHEDAFDRLTMLVQQLEDQLSRVVALPPELSGTVLLPVPSNGKLLGWSGTALANFDPGGGLINPMTASGDMIVGGVGGTPERLAVGTEGQIPTVQVDGSIEWQDPSPGIQGLPWWDPMPPTPPVSADFTWTNASGIDLTGAMQIRGDGPGTVGLRAGSISAPVDVTALMAAMVTDPGSAGARVGIVGVNAAGDTLLFFGMALIAGVLTLQVETFDFPAMTSTGVKWSVPLAGPSCPIKLSMHLPEDSGSSTFSVSLGDSSLLQVYTEPTSTLGNFSAQVGLCSIGSDATVANIIDFEL